MLFLERSLLIEVVRLTGLFPCVFGFVTRSICSERRTSLLKPDDVQVEVALLDATGLSSDAASGRTYELVDGLWFESLISSDVVRSGSRKIESGPDGEDAIRKSVSPASTTGLGMLYL